MFWQTYKTTFKNLLRSVLFWAILVAICLIVLYWGTQPSYVDYDDVTGEVYKDTDARFVLIFSKYLQVIPNRTRVDVMYVAMPIFAVLTTVLVMNRSLGDGFFEIEKSGGVKPSRYFLGRLAALISLNLIVSAIMSLFSVNYYYFTRGGVAGLPLTEHLKISTVRILRIVFCCELPALLLVIGITYMIGNLLKSGFAGLVGGGGFAIAMYWFHNTKYFVRNMVDPAMKFRDLYWMNSYLFFTYYDLDTDFARTDFENVMVWMSLVLSISMLCFVVS